ncbi:hypothetical protein QZH41_001335 [Actinostola sp. cb2023]|nr:hypothetical protein QZH41_001335 [Actinostola sp. cb2023]
MSLTVQELKKIWKNEFLAEVRQEIQKETQRSKNDMATLQKKLAEVEDSHQFLSIKYDSILATLQDVKKQVQLRDGQMADIQREIENVRCANYELHVQVDDLQQYSRRDCLEICGISVVPNDDPAKLVIEMANLADIKLEDKDISIAHRLPPTRKVQNRIIVKFTRRETKDLVYKKRGKLKPKRSRDLPLVRAEPESATVNHKAAIHVNESLTPYRKRLLGRILEFKRKYNYKYVWTVNGKIMMRESDSTTSCSFTTDEQFDDFFDNHQAQY